MDNDRASLDEITGKKQKCVDTGSDRPIVNVMSTSSGLEGTEPVCNDASTLAAHFSKVKCSGDRLPPPDILVEDRLYADMSLRGTKVCSNKRFSNFLSISSDANYFLLIIVRGVHQ